MKKTLTYLDVREIVPDPQVRREVFPSDWLTPLEDRYIPLHDVLSNLKSTMEACRPYPGVDLRNVSKVFETLLVHQDEKGLRVLFPSGGWASSTMTSGGWDVFERVYLCKPRAYQEDPTEIREKTLRSVIREKTLRSFLERQYDLPD